MLFWLCYLFIYFSTLFYSQLPCSSTVHSHRQHSNYEIGIKQLFFATAEGVICLFCVSSSSSLRWTRSSYTPPSPGAAAEKSSDDWPSSQCHAKYRSERHSCTEDKRLLSFKGVYHSLLKNTVLTWLPLFGNSFWTQSDAEDLNLKFTQENHWGFFRATCYDPVLVTWHLISFGQMFVFLFKRRMGEDYNTKNTAPTLKHENVSLML